MALKVITGPTAQPIAVADVEAQVRASLTAETALIDLYIKAVTAKAEGYLKRSIITQTLQLSLERFTFDSIKLPAGPVQSISSITYLDGDGVQQTISPSLYQLGLDDTACPAWGGSWPGVRVQPDSVKITYVAGYGLADDVPAEIKAWMLLNVANLYENRETVVSGNMSELNTLADGLISPLVNW
jgi:uncharacterized phiE125 gp8 family phage protein